MANIQADTSGITGAAADFSRQSGDLGTLISQVHGTLLNLEPLWKGPAALEFQGLMSRWETNIKDIEELLAEIARRVNSAGLGYQDLDSQIQRSFSTV